VSRLRILTLTALAVAGATAECEAGPCTEQIVAVEKQIRQAQASGTPGGAGAPSAPQSIGAQLHHQPTPGSVESAEHNAAILADGALNRARAADAAGDMPACKKALDDAKELYGLP
jgi:hypothetical protein